MKTLHFQYLFSSKERAALFLAECHDFGLYQIDFEKVFSNTRVGEHAIEDMKIGSMGFYKCVGTG